MKYTTVDELRSINRELMNIHATGKSAVSGLIFIEEERASERASAFKLEFRKIHGPRRNRPPLPPPAPSRRLLRRWRMIDTETAQGGGGGGSGEEISKT